MNKILVVEDDESLARLYQSILAKNNFVTLLAENGQAALEVMAATQVDLVIMDVMMPEMDGYELAGLLREAGYDLPLLMVTAKDSFEDKKRGFKLGVDDYMVKPVDVEEMLWRVEALLRRSKIIHDKKLVIGQTTLDQESYTVNSAQKSVELPQKEFQLLYKLLSYPNKIFTRQQLMDDIWGLDTDSDERTIDVHIKRLRGRFAESSDFQLTTIRGLGYKAVLRS